MRISVPIDVWDPARGGAEKYLQGLSLALARRGHEVTILCLKKRESNTADGVRVEVLKAPRFPRWLREIAFAYRSVEAHRRSGRDLLFAVRHALEADVYQPHGGSFKAARLAAPLSLSPLERKARSLLAAFRPTIWVLFWLDREVFRRSPRVVTVSLSRKVEEDFQRTYPEVFFRFERVYGAIETERFHDRDRPQCAAHLRGRFGIPSGDHIALFVAHRFRLKGLVHALRSLQHAPRWHLVVGGRDDPASYRKEALRLGLEARVHFLGALDDTRALYAGGDALLLPTYYDPCSMAVLESLSCGTPVITTRQNGACEILEEGRSGFVLEEPRAEKAMARALSEIALSWEGFHAAALRARERLDWNAHVDRMERILLDSLDSMRGGISEGGELQSS